MSGLRASLDGQRDALEALTVEVMCIEVTATDEHVLGEVRGLQADLRESGALVDQQDRMLRLLERRDALVAFLTDENRQG